MQITIVTKQNTCVIMTELSPIKENFLGLLPQSLLTKQLELVPDASQLFWAAFREVTGYMSCHINTQSINENELY